MISKTIWICGLSGSGKTTIGQAVADKVGYLMDGDVLRDGLNINLGHSVAGRRENIRRAAEVCKILNSAGVTVVAAFITPLTEFQRLVKMIIPNVKLVYLDVPLEVCEQRDPKGLYVRARAGAITNFTGIGSPFIPPENADLVLSEMPLDAAVKEILCLLDK